MLYLVYKNNDYFGFTYSKSVAKKLKKADPSIQYIPTYRAPPDEDKLSDDWFIDKITLIDRFDRKVDIITTHHEMYNANIWILRLFEQHLSEPIMDIIIRGDLYRLPMRLQNALQEYISVIEAIFNQELDMSVVYEQVLTYEGFVLYQNRDQKEGGLMLI